MVRAVGRGLAAAAAAVAGAVGNAVAVVVIVGGLFAVLMLAVFAFSWVGIQIQEQFFSDEPVDYQAQEICWVEEGVNHLEYISGPRSNMPETSPSAIEVACPPR